MDRIVEKRMIFCSWNMPSTAFFIDPRGPRSARPGPCTKMSAVVTMTWMENAMHRQEESQNPLFHSAYTGASSASTWAILKCSKSSKKQQTQDGKSTVVEMVAFQCQLCISAVYLFTANPDIIAPSIPNVEYKLVK